MPNAPRRTEHDPSPRPDFDPQGTEVSVRRALAYLVDGALVGLVNGLVLSWLWPAAPGWLSYVTWAVLMLPYLGVLQGITATYVVGRGTAARARLAPAA